MASVVDIINISLTYLGASLINSLDETHQDAQYANKAWPTCRDAVLRRYPWRCARGRAVLAPLAQPGITGWSNVFQLPDDCLRVLWIGSKERPEPYMLEKRNIYYNGTVLNLVYTERVVDTDQYDPLLVEALGLYIAHMLSMKLVQSDPLTQRLWAQYGQVLQQAAAVDSQEGGDSFVELDEGTWLGARR